MEYLFELFDGRQVGSVALASPAETVPVRRYERASPGKLLHLDTKKLVRFDRPGHRVTGDGTQNTPRVGWQALHVATDDHSRIALNRRRLPNRGAEESVSAYYGRVPPGMPARHGK